MFVYTVRRDIIIQYNLKVKSKTVKNVNNNIVCCVLQTDPIVVNAVIAKLDLF